MSDDVTGTRAHRKADKTLRLHTHQGSVVREDLLQIIGMVAHFSFKDSLARGQRQVVLDIVRQCFSAPEGKGTHSGFRLIRALGNKSVADTDGRSQMANQSGEKVASGYRSGSLDD